MNSIYAPGKNPGRVEYPPDRYNPRQEHIYQAISKITYAHQEGRLHTLWPSPGFSFDVSDYTEWKIRAMKAWKDEAGSRGRGITRGFVEEDLMCTCSTKEHPWFWLYQRIKAAPPNGA